MTLSGIQLDCLRIMAQGGTWNPYTLRMATGRRVSERTLRVLERARYVRNVRLLNFAAKPEGRWAALEEIDG